jgi:anti-sigma factor RsiW
MSDDRHPEELLAGYVDGTLGDKERAVVEVHLATCDRCRQESALAMRATGLLRGIGEEPVPFGVMNPVTAEIGRRMNRTSPRPLSQRVLWAAGGAIAAAFVGILAVWVLPSVGGNQAATSGGGGAAEAGAPLASATGGAVTVAGAAVTLERQTTNYDNVSLQTLATETAAQAKAGSVRSAADASAQPAGTASAVACLRRGAGIDPQDILVRLIAARFQGRPSVIGVYLTSPAPGRSPDTVLVWVVETDTCAFASYTQARI